MKIKNKIKFLKKFRSYGFQDGFLPSMVMDSGYILEADWKGLRDMARHVSRKNNKSRPGLYLGCILNTYLYDIEPRQYFLYKFYNKDHKEKTTYWTNKEAVKYNVKMNKDIMVFEDKLRFNEKFKNYFKHNVYSLEYLKSHPDFLQGLLDNSEHLVVKVVRFFNYGDGVKVIRSAEYDAESLIQFMEKNNFGMLEEYIQQHEKMNRLSPRSINTIRVISQLAPDGSCQIVACRLRMSVDSSVDNLRRGGMAAVVDKKTGTVVSDAFYIDPTKDPCNHHPRTGIKIPGFQIPFWPEVIGLVQRASQVSTENKSVGWDVVITPHGPSLIEGNPGWCKELLQVPAQQGLRHLLLPPTKH